MATKEDFDYIIEESKKLLIKDKLEWGDRYTKYAKSLLEKLGTEVNPEKKKRKPFNEFPPFCLYMNLTNAKGSGKFSLRYAGQEVAELSVINEDEVRISTKDDNNKTFFDCDIQLNNVLWRSTEAKKFRKHFRHHELIRNDNGRKNEEHRIESMLLGEFSKKKSKGKFLSDIQPVRLFGVRFPMPTPLSASKAGKNIVKYNRQSRGCIDILCRIGHGKNTKLCVIEVKDENVPKEPPQYAIKEAIAYAVFLRELLRTESGNDWYKIFGFGKRVPKELKIIVSVAMPYKEEKALSSDFDNMKIELGNGDKLILHSIFFEEKERKLVKLHCSWKKE